MLSLWWVTVTAVFTCCRLSRVGAAQVGLLLPGSNNGTSSQGLDESRGCRRKRDIL